jgi:RluA family pseudouridine synthase
MPSMVPDPAAALSRTLGAMTSLPILHEDGSLLVVDKPAGLPVHGSGGGEATVETVLRRQLGGRAVRMGFTLSAVHRLDRDTSGVLVLARRRKACQRVMEQFADGSVEKRYLALVLRGPPSDEGTIDAPLAGLGKHAGTLQDALTEFRVVSRGAEAALVGCQPRTGRTHQIRRHLASIGCPLAGDERYGSARFDAHAKAAWGLDRMFLHAAELTLAHPDSGENVTFRAPLPEPLQQVLERSGMERYFSAT